MPDWPVPKPVLMHEQQQQPQQQPNDGVAAHSGRGGGICAHSPGPEGSILTEAELQHIVDNSADALRCPPADHSHQTSDLCDRLCKSLTPPFFSWALKYTWEALGSDVVTGVTVGAIVVPQGMAYAMLAELPPIYGLYTALTPPPIYGFLCTSRHLSIGPFALVSLLIADTVGKVYDSDEDPEEYARAVVTLSLMVGVMHLVMGALRLGQLFAILLSDSVLAGFQFAAAILIATSQLKHLLGMPIPRSSLVDTLLHVWHNWWHINAVSLFTGTTGFFFMRHCKRINARYCPYVKLPEQLILIAMATALCALFSEFTPTMLPLLGELSSEGLPRLIAPNLEMIPRLVQPALVVGGFSFVLSYGCVRTFALRYEYETDANQELFALGAANVIGSFFLSYPSAGSLSRSAVVSDVGADRVTPFHGFITAMMVVSFLLLFTPIFTYMPKAVLAAVVFGALNTLFDTKQPLELLRVSRADFGLWLVAFVATLLLGVQVGSALSIIASLLQIVASSAKPHFAQLGEIPLTGIWRDVKRYQEAQTPPGVLVMRFDGPLHFVNQLNFRDDLLKRLELASPGETSSRAPPPSQFSRLAAGACTHSHSRLGQSIAPCGESSAAENGVVDFSQSPSAGGQGPDSDDESVASTVVPTVAILNESKKMLQRRLKRRSLTLKLFRKSAARFASDAFESQERGMGTHDVGSDELQDWVGAMPVGDFGEATCERQCAISVVIVHADGISYVDHPALNMLRSLHAELSARGVQIFFSACKGQVRDTLARAGLVNIFGLESFFVNLNGAIIAAKRIHQVKMQQPREEQQQPSGAYPNPDAKPHSDSKDTTSARGAMVALVNVL